MCLDSPTKVDFWHLCSENMQKADIIIVRSRITLLQFLQTFCTLLSVIITRK